nr:hypothetical protein GCM10017745_72470 [Saccharothrix mutabilis subsp. capreolus]
MSDDERIPLDLLDPAAVRKRARTVAIGALLVAAAFGGLLGLLAGRTAGLVTAAVFALPLLLLAWSEARRRVWLSGHVLTVRAFGARSVDLHTADQLDLLVTDMRGSRTVGLFVRGGGKAINLALAIYAGTGGREQGVLALRKLADVLAGRGDARAWCSRSCWSHSCERRPEAWRPRTGRSTSWAPWPRRAAWRRSSTRTPSPASSPPWTDRRDVTRPGPSPCRH